MEMRVKLKDFNGVKGMKVMKLLKLLKLLWRYLRDVSVNQILEGTNEIMRLIISRKILGVNK